MKRSHRVLVVDDAELMQEQIAHSLKRLEGVELIQAYSGEEAIDAMRSRRPSLVILDLALPGIQGQEVLALCHDDAQLAKTPIVVLTAAETEGDLIERLLLLGASDYLHKPIRGEELCQYVRARLRLADRASQLRHDFTNPLTAVLSYAELLMLDDVARNPDEVCEFAREILRAGQRLGEMYAQLVQT